MNKSLVSLTFDDGLRCQFERAVPMLDRHRFPATFFLVANTESIFEDPWAEAKGYTWNKISWSKDEVRLLKTMAARGHEIASHTVKHERQPTDPVFEATESKRLIEGWMGMEVPSFCYPFYDTIESLREPVIAAGYRQARAGRQNSFYAVGDSIDYFGVDCRQISQTGEDVGSWVRPGCWHVVTFHGIGTERDGWEPVTEREFSRLTEELASLRDSGQVEVVTFKEGAERMRQVNPH
ncbi:MAG TPA: polysaccharide deacetylase family protein [Terriglobales bacterium]|jgi:peptidoglycan/xylan/chitin deacetylase (PgdA/CDA1 family)|nr:polysaccharide deacetylase family protein [Terriglobales bacterium]